MKNRVTFFIIIAIIVSSCSDCRNDDCGGDDYMIFNINGVAETNYSDSIDFYYLDNDLKQVHADIDRSRTGTRTYYAFLNYRGAEPKNRYYLEYKNQMKTVDIKTRYDKDPCCGDYLRFEEIRIDGQLISLPIEIEFD